MPQPGNNGGNGFSWFYVYLTSEPAYNPGDGGRGQSWFVVELTSEPVYLPGDRGQSWFVVELTTDPVYDGISPRGLGPKWRIGRPSLAYVQVFSPTGIAPTAAVGQPLVDVGTAQTLEPAAIESGAQSGTPSLASRQIVNTAGIAPTSQVGTPTGVPDQSVVPVGLESTAELGDPSLAIGTSQEITTQGLESTAQLGEPALDSRKLLAPHGIGPTAQFGTAEITNVKQAIWPPSIGPTSGMGRPSLSGEIEVQPRPGVGGQHFTSTGAPLVGQEIELRIPMTVTIRRVVRPFQASIPGSVTAYRTVEFRADGAATAIRSIEIKHPGIRLSAQRWNKLLAEEEDLLTLL